MKGLRKMPFFKKLTEEEKQQKQVEKLEKIEALQAELDARKRDKLVSKGVDTESYTRRMVEVEKLYQEFSVNTFGNKKTLDKLIQQANNSENLKCVMPGNVKIIEKATGKKVSSFPGAWFVSDQRVVLCFPEPFGETRVYEYSVETLESVSARGNGLTAAVVQIATSDELITLAVSYKEETYRNIERVFDELIHGALDLRQSKTKEVDGLGIAVCSSCKASKILAKGAVENCDYCRQPIAMHKAPVQTTQTTISSLSPADEILKLKSLLDAGIISQEEFDHKKKQLLGM